MNKTITIYELLGLIKEEQAPKKILYDNYIWSWTGDDYNTILKGEKEQFLITGMYYTWLSEFLDDTVEIIDNNKIEKLDELIEIKSEDKIGSLVYEISCMQRKINEIIDEINKLKENK